MHFHTVLIPSLLLVVLPHLNQIHCLDCHELLSNEYIKNIEWHNLKLCLNQLTDRELPQKTSENIWRLVKIAFNGVQNIPAEAYGNLGYALTSIPKTDLLNIRMERVEIVEAFGAIGKSDNADIASTTPATPHSFSHKKMRIIAEKVRYEWLGKNPKTYSEYDLISLGQILCHLNISDIAQIQPDAFRYAAEWIGSLQNCPQDSLKAFAALAVNKAAFGRPYKWSKIDLTIIGNILNGLSKSDIDSIDERKLHLNRFYVRQNHTSRATTKPKQISMPSSSNATQE